MRKSEGIPTGGKGRKLRRGMGILLAAALVFNTLSSGGLEVSASETQEASPMCETGSGGVSGGDHVEDTGLCPIEDSIAALPQTVTEDNAEPGEDIFADMISVPEGYTVTYTHTDGQTISRDVTIAGAQTTLSDAAAYKEDGTSADTFDIGEKIIVKVTSAFPANNAIMAAAFTEPIGGQMAVYYEGGQISEPSNGEDGVYTMTVDTNDLPEEALNREITLTVKYIGSDNVLGAAASVSVTVTAAAKLEKDGTTTCYSNIYDALRAAKNNGDTTVRLLCDTSYGSTISFSDANCTFDLNGHILTIAGDISVDSGRSRNTRLTIMDSSPDGSGELVSTRFSAVEASTYGTLIITGGTFTAGNDSWGSVRSSGGDILLRGGTFSSIGSVASNMLGHEGEKRYAYYDKDDKLITDITDKLSGPVTVKECTHEGEGVCDYLPVEGEEKHQMHCRACDKRWEAETCTSFTYAPIEDDAEYHTATCNDCGGEKKEEHEFARMFRSANDNAMTNWNICVNKCQYLELMATVTVSIPDNLTYGENGDRELTYAIDPEMELDEMKWLYYNVRVVSESRDKESENYRNMYTVEMKGQKMRYFETNMGSS